MASVKLEHIYKVYTGGVKAVSDMTLDIKDGEFIVFVGPSGCGKSTTLRMIAGLEQITAGELYIGDQIVNDVEPKDRDIAMVFQNYALYPQMTVYENMAFGLRLRHIPSDVIQTKVMWAANILGLTEMLDRKPKAMSGGQRQRVALGRAILRDPKVMLLDEPLSNLDAKLRTSMRTEIAKLHQKLKTTFIYVTHDQTEAMTLGDKVVVMKKGTVQQFDTPKNLYNYPTNKFVAGFIGTPQMNFFDGKLTRVGDKVHIKLDKSKKELVADFNDFTKVDPHYLDGKKEVIMGIRCEHLFITKEENERTLPVRISRFEELGAEALIYGDIDIDNTAYNTTGSSIIIRVASLPEDIKLGDVIHVSLDMDHTYFFDKGTEESIVPRIPSVNIVDASVKDHQLSFLGETVPLPTALTNVPDFKQGELWIPNDAFLFDDNGFEATVESTEVIGTTNLVHLLVGGRILFTLADKVYAPGTKVRLGLDYSRLTFKFKEEKEEKVIEPLRKFDAFHASFYNLKTALARTNNDPEFIKVREERINASNEKYDSLLGQAKADYEKAQETSIPADIKNILSIKDAAQRDSALSNAIVARKKNAKLALAKDKAQMKEAIKLLKNTRKVSKKALKEKHKQELAAAKEKNDEVYAKAKQQEKESYRKFLSVNKDREASKRRREEYRMFMSTFTDQKTNALNTLIQGIDLNYDNELSKIEATYKRGVKSARQAYKERKAFYARWINPVEALEKDYLGKVNQLEKEKKQAALVAGNVFLFGIGNYFFMSTPIISGKLIQGLGTRVFTKQFLIEVPHDAYVESKKGIDGVVLGEVNYGQDKYFHVSFTDAYGDKKDAFIKSNASYKEGDHLKIAFDITKSQITETGMGIRLY